VLSPDNFGRLAMNWMDEKLLIPHTEPGGYLQWTEGNMPAYITRHTTQPTDPTCFPAMHTFEQFHLQTLKRQPPRVNDWVTQLGAHFEKHGLLDVAYEEFSVPKRYWPAWTDVMMLILEEVGMLAGMPELLELVRKAAAEVKLGAMQTTLWPVVCVGRRPL